jgi:transposase
MDSNKLSAQIERLEVVETGRCRRWSDDEKLKIVLKSLQTLRAVSSTARRYGALAAADLAAIVLEPRRATVNSLSPLLCRRW